MMERYSALLRSADIFDKTKVDRLTDDMDW